MRRPRKPKPITGNLTAIQGNNTLVSEGRTSITGAASIVGEGDRLQGEAWQTLRPLGGDFQHQVDAIDVAIRELRKHGESEALTGLQRVRRELAHVAVDAARRKHRPRKPGTARAVAAVLARRLSMAEAAEAYGIKRRTLADHVTRARPRKK